MEFSTAQDAVAKEFATVNTLLESDHETRAVDAFTISWVKLERQLRRLTVNLIFQHSQFNAEITEGDQIKGILLKKQESKPKRLHEIYRGTLRHHDAGDDRRAI